METHKTDCLFLFHVVDAYKRAFIKYKGVDIYEQMLFLY